MYPIGHDTVHDQYKVVCIVSAHKELEHWVFILREGVSSQGRKISSPCPPHYPEEQRLTINGRMYYLALVSLKYHVLVSFDFSSEETRLLPKPEDVFWHGFYINLIEYAGKISFFGHSDLVKDGVMKLWVMEDEEKNIWSRKKLVLHPSQMDMVKVNNADNNYCLNVYGTTRNGDVILAPQKEIYPRPVEVLPSRYNTLLRFTYNIQKNHLRKIEIKDGSNCFLKYQRCEVIGLDDTRDFMHL
ncbi:hypothetical protein F2Q70_00031573 [Brassica cretica]|uniref:F-box associated beta-propeller type 3 domain-containing protein n=1 Tax=Brassica cretica TaxID=69181 RepID=A0A8S9GXV2_BRACR|nr:hypothetical protein F2Q70_00031573 [Brassica cretica]KAF2551235.1 hypothetical protein F2Q68_00036018 [Brassica cretica]